MGASLPLVALLAACGHEAARDNPFDPQLTPAVEDVAAANGERRGAVVVTWTAYAGRQPFARYIVLRKEQGLEQVDTVGFVESAAVEALVDTKAVPARDYHYWVDIVNTADLVVASDTVSVRSAGLPTTPPRLRKDPARGLVRVEWMPYDGTGFEALEVWRRTFDSQAQRVWWTDDPAATTYDDTSAVPDIVYTYWLRTRVFGDSFDSRADQVAYSLPGIEVSSVELSSATASAVVRWTQYGGPRFRAYSVVRQRPSRPDTVVAEIGDLATTSTTDSLLDGNTEYRYLVRVHTDWQGVVVEGTSQSGRFHARTAVLELEPPTRQDSASAQLSVGLVQSVALAIDEDGGVHAVTSSLSSNSRLMLPGLSWYAAGEVTARHVVPGAVADRLSPLCAAILDGSLYVAFTDAEGSLRVATADEDGVQRWERVVAGSTTAAALLVEDGGVVLVDQQGWIQRFDPATGDSGGRDEALRLSLVNEGGLPVQAVVEAPGAGLRGQDQWILLATRRDLNKVLGRTQTLLGESAIFSGRTDVYDDGVGAGRGQTLDPVAVAYDATRTRLLLLESRGVLQVMDARLNVERRFITRWGRFGRGDGEFFLSPVTAGAVAVDGEGRIHVADAASTGGRIQVFEP